MKKSLITALLLVFTLTTIAQVKQEKFQRAKLFYSQASDLQILENLGVPIDHGIRKPGVFMISEFSASHIDIIKNAGFKVDILIEDTKQHFIDENNKRLPMANPSCAQDGGNEYPVPANFNLGSMGGYLTYQEALDELDAMKAAYPNLISTKQNISTFLTEGQPDNSVTPSIGGNGIKWVRISDNPEVDEAEQEILYSAIHHAREPMSLMQMIYYMWYLLENYDSNNEIQNIVNNTELYFVPVVNPDGYLYNERIEPNGGGLWRKNRRNNGGGNFGVDNNRNYDYFENGNPSQGVWGGEGASANPSSETYRGSGPFSEIENQAMKWFVEQHDFVMAFNNHTFGNLLLYPFGYTDNALTEDNDLFVAVGDELVSQNGFDNILSSGLYPAAGDSDDFMYGTVNTHDPIYAFTPEIGPAFWPSSNQIIPLAQGMMYFNITAAQMVNNFAAITDTESLYLGTAANQTASFDIRRLGVTGNGTFTVSMEPISTNIEANGPSASFPSMDLLQTQSGAITYNLIAGTTAGEPVVYDLVVNNGAFNTRTRVSKIFGGLETVFVDEGNSVNTNFNNNGWATTTQTFVSPSSSITESPSGNYQNNATETITLIDPIDLTDATGANVSFYARWEIETGWDYVQFEISTNNGGTWIPQCGNFTNPGSTNGFQPEGEPLYDGTQNTWVLEEIDLSDYLGETIIARFQFRSDEFQRRDGFYFDDLTFNVLEPSVLDVATFDSQFSIYPNPVDGMLNIISSLQGYDLVLHNIQGQKISEVKNLNGPHQLDLESLATGLYILKVHTGEITETIKIIKK